jgi:hypothetical protein
MTSTKELSDKFTCLDSYFKSLPNAVKRIGLSEEAIAGCVSGLDEAHCEEEEAQEKEKASEEEEKEERESSQRREVVTFHSLADAVIVVMAGIQELVKKKHSEFAVIQGI